MQIIEKRFRGSLICRVLSYPITYAIAKVLLENGPMDLSGIVILAKRSKSTVCGHLAKLKLVNIVRYEKAWRKTIYWIKYPSETRKFLSACEELVERTTKRIKEDS